jgi:UPF0716 protein FxsA
MYYLPVLVFLPFLELAGFGLVAARTGFLPALSLLLLGAVGGIALIQNQSLGSVFRLREALEGKPVRSDEIFSSLCLAAAGILFFIPGFITDILGFLLLAPFARNWLRRALERRPERPPPAHGPQDVIEGEYERTED